MKVEESGAPGFSKEYINRRRRICSEICCLAFSFARHPSLTRSRTHSGNFVRLQRSAMTPISLMCSWMSWSTEGSVSNSRLQHRGNAPACIRYVWCWLELSLPPSSASAGRITPSIKHSLSPCKHALKKSFVLLPLRRSERRQLLQLITCSDGLPDTRCCRSVALKVPLRGHFHPIKDFWVALEHFPEWNIFYPGLHHNPCIHERDRIHNYSWITPSTVFMTSLETALPKEGQISSNNPQHYYFT